MVAAVLEPVVNERWANVPDNNFDLLTGPHWDAKSPEEQTAWRWMAGMARTPFHRFIFQTYANMFRQPYPVGEARPEGEGLTPDEQRFLAVFNELTLEPFEKQEHHLFISEFAQALSVEPYYVEAYHTHVRRSAETMANYVVGEVKLGHQPYGNPCQLMIDALEADEANALMTLWNMSKGLLYLKDYATICQPIQKLMALRSKLSKRKLADNNALIQIVVAYY